MSREDEDKTLKDIFVEMTGRSSVTEEQDEQAKEGVIESDGKSRKDALPKTEVACPECSHSIAHWYTEQTRAADEPGTRFYICEKCGNKWRDYD